METRREVRSQTGSVIRSNQSRTVSGTAVVYNSESRDLGGFKEIILPSAMDNVIEKSDVLALLNHDVSKGVLARSTFGVGTLILRTDKNALNYEFAAPLTSLGDEVIEGIKRGDLQSSSFAFTVAQGGESWEKRSGKTYRVISQFEQLFDISPCWRPAYSETQVALRHMKVFSETGEASRFIEIDFEKEYEFGSMDYRTWPDFALKTIALREAGNMRKLDCNNLTASVEILQRMTKYHKDGSFDKSIFADWRPYKY